MVEIVVPSGSWSTSDMSLPIVEMVGFAVGGVFWRTSFPDESVAANGMNPIAYLTDVLTRISDERNLDALLPDRFRQPRDG